jgi:hypothetical protein
MDILWCCCYITWHFSVVHTCADACYIKKNPQFDMTPLLGGTDAVFSSLIHSFSWFVTLLLACLVSDVLFYVFVVNIVSVWLFQEPNYISSCLYLPSFFLCNKASCRRCLARHCWFWCFVCNTDVQAQGLTLLNFFYLYNDDLE